MNFTSAAKWRQVVATKRRSGVAAKRRQDVAMGVSPWISKHATRSPEGTKGSPSSRPPFAPSGLPNQSRYANHGLAPMATTFRPFGTQLTWVGKLHAFLEFNDRAVLNHAGSIQKKVADRLALDHFDVYSAELRRIEATEPTNDFDRFIDGVKRIRRTEDNGDA